MSERRSAVVTGAAKGIGRATAGGLIGAGWCVAGLDRDAAALRRAGSELGEAFAPVTGDVTDWGAHEAAAAAAEALGPLRGWVNNAGVDVQGAAHEVDAAAIRDGIGLLQFSAMYGTAVAVRRMLAGGAGGAIVNVGSIQGLVAFPGYFVYQAAKAAIAMISRGVAVDYGAHGIRCNAVLPGAVDTPMTEEGIPAGVAREDALREFGRLAPLDRIGEAAEVADVIAFLLSDAASYVTGQALPVDGGATARCFAYPPPDVPATGP